MISSPGVGSGLDISSLITQLVAIEQQPLFRLASREAGLQGQLSAYGQLKGALSTFQSSLQQLDDVADFKVLSATSTDSDVLVATANSTAGKGVFNIEVNRLAENHRMAGSTAYADIDTTTIGVGGETMTIDVGGDDFTIAFGGLTLGEIRDAINASSDNSGVTASILNDDAGHRLILSGDETGSDNFVTVSYSAADPFAMNDLNTDRDGDLSFTSADLDAELTVEGTFTVTRTRNNISDVISGVTLNLLEAGTTTVNIDNDFGAVEDSVNALVGSFNTVISTVRQLGNGALSADRAAVSRIESQLRAVLNSPAQVGGAFSSIFEVGLGSNFIIGSDAPSNGELELDADALLEALQTDPDSVAALFTDSDNGIVTGLLGLVDGYLDVDGLIDGKQDAVNARIDDIGDQRVTMERHIALVEQRLIQEFTALDTLLAQLQNTGNLLTQQLQALPKITILGND